MQERNGRGAPAHGFERVLDAEKAADVRLAQARAAAGALVQAARATERAIAARADGRLRLLHRDLQASVERERARMARAFEAERRDLATPPGSDVIDAAAERLARRLAGIDAP